ncbi:MAG: hypothetical protein CML16_03055 [Pusillimonas sp.]|nr:hypothetical protein [Pusillimonas sp.]MBC43566.1 hypothetical protein [Pusillimonas sp.]HCP78944.1 hypothetical protein [Pusillimonas sp.]|tara:strand:+ start:11992 stop:12411 length:420 start_codon:yes stop_codon:yes gene_type:complete
MATHHASDFNQKPLHMSAYGNAWAEDYEITATVLDTEKAYFGVIPAGVRVYEVRLKHHAAGTDTTCKVGFEPMDGDSPTADDDYWFVDTTDVAAAGVKESTSAPITFQRPVKLVLTAGGANFAAGTMSIIVNGKVVGVA